MTVFFFSFCYYFLLFLHAAFVLIMVSCLSVCTLQHTTKTSMPQAEFETRIPAHELPQSYALYCAVTGSGKASLCASTLLDVCSKGSVRAIGTSRDTVAAVSYDGRLFILYISDAVNCTLLLVVLKIWNFLCTFSGR